MFRCIAEAWALCLALACLSVPASASCPRTSSTTCGACPSTIADRFLPDAAVQIVGNQNMRCAVSGLDALARAGCLEGSCYSVVEVDVPLSYTDCETSQSEACVAWRWLHCAFPDDQTAGGVIMHAYFFVSGAYQGMGFDFAQKDVSALLSQAGASTVADGCARKYKRAAGVVSAKLAAGYSKGLVLFGWDGCPCTGIAQARFRSVQLCHEQLTWSNADSDVMKYLQCKEKDPSHHSFVYFRNGEDWSFKGTGFAFDVRVVAEPSLMSMADKAGVLKGCVDALAVNVYGEPLSECRAAMTDRSGSWMWDGKCSEEGGGVHQICMEQLPADFSETTGQGPWSEGRAGMRHCVCIGAWSLYMTREDDPAWTTSSAWPLCDAVPLSALTERYIGKWKDWNGIPASIAAGARKLVEKCLSHRAGPGSAAPTQTAACHLLEAFKTLQAAESGLAAVDADALAANIGLDCSGVATDFEASEAPALDELNGEQGGSGTFDNRGADDEHPAGAPRDTSTTTQADTLDSPTSPTSSALRFGTSGFHALALLALKVIVVQPSFHGA